MSEIKIVKEKKREKNVSILNRLNWTVQPPKGFIKGEYYKAENWFAPHFEGDTGYHGILEVVIDKEKIRMVEYNEINSESYYIKKYQGVSKRLSDYGFMQATKERTEKSGVVLVNGLNHLEKQMLNENTLVGDFDLLTGASNSIKRSMLKLAEHINIEMGRHSGKYYYGLSEQVDIGITGRLQLVIENKEIILCFYDEIFADNPEEIENNELKQYYRQSKYHCLDYVSTMGVGFNTFSDILGETVLNNQDLFCIEKLPLTDESKSAGEIKHYLQIAKKIDIVLKEDGIIND